MKKRGSTKKIASKNLLIVGTRKGVFFFHSDSKRKTWKVNGPHFLGTIIHHAVLDPRDNKTILATHRPGHLGPSIFKSQNFGKTWKEVKLPPAFPKSDSKKTAKSVDHVFWLTPSSPSEPNVWYAGTSPQGLFRSEDAGETWQEVKGFNHNSNLSTWTGGEQDLTPDGGKMHSIIVDPRDSNHLYLGMSSGGTFESLDRGATWKRLNKGCDRVFEDADPDAGHDPHCIVMNPENPDRLYMQNHCGIYTIERPSETWIRIGKNMPKSVGDIGFPIVSHPKKENTAWVFPMDGSQVWPRVSPDGKPAVFKTTNFGKTWTKQNKGLPKNQAWYTVKRQAMSIDQMEKVGIYFGTTSGEVWGSSDEGSSWKAIAMHLPHIYSVEAYSY